MKPIRSLALVVNASKPGAVALARELSGTARAMGVRIKQTTRFPVPRGYLHGCDACCVIGGDGTLLGVAREATIEQVPIIGVNRGSLGFLTTFSSEEARSEFADLMRGRFRIDRRSLLECSVAGGPRGLALNEVLIKDEVNTRLVQLEVSADGELVTDYLSDGLIFSTPTGSTAYNLSAGGPIIHPSASVIAMTPICPHTLSNRSIIFRDSVKLKVVNRLEGTRLLVALDGTAELHASAGETVDIATAPATLALAQHEDYSYFAVMRTKLKWSGGVA